MNVPPICPVCGGEIGHCARGVIEALRAKRGTDWTQYKPIITGDPENMAWHDNREIFRAFGLDQRKWCCINTIFTTVNISEQYGMPVRRHPPPHEQQPSSSAAPSSS
jgi:DNA-directed RNA polymerase subunit N (RpoN/RPB10)